MRIYSAFNFRRLRYTLGVPSIEVILKLNFHVQSRKIDGVDGYEVIWGYNEVIIDIPLVSDWLASILYSILANE